MAVYLKRYLGDFPNTDFAYFLHYSHQDREDYISNSDPIIQYVDNNRITNDFLKMLIIVRDTLMYSEMWFFRFGISNANIKLANIKIHQFPSFQKVKVLINRKNQRRIHFLRICS